MRFRLRTLMIAVTAIALTCGGWAAALDSALHGRINLVQLGVLVVAWGFALSIIQSRLLWSSNK